MGEVYRATDSVLERKVAVKLLSERYARDDDVRARFRREALAAARLSGAPHVDHGLRRRRARERPFIVMEYLEGGSVHDRLRERAGAARTGARVARRRPRRRSTAAHAGGRRPP